MRRWGLAVLALAGLGLPASAQTVTSAGPDSVAVAIYRAPERPAGEPLDLDWLEGYALISEQRTITIPAGRTTIRFEGVAGGILPESAIVTGLPDGVREKNLDADLLSPRSLYARNLNRPVTIRRTLGGKVVEERAVIRSGPDGAAVFETRDGIVAADCRPKTDEVIYDAVPAGLSARPTLSVETEAAGASQVTVTLSYLAWGFDWQANYIATMLPDGRSADLFAWVTLANGDVTSFADADTAVIAGNIHRETERDYRDGSAQPFWFRCLSTITRTLKRESNMVVDAISANDVGVFPDTNIAESLQRIPGVSINRFATREELGDLQLYRIPDRTTVAAMSQKQVALLDRQSVPVEIVHRLYIRDDALDAAWLVLRAQNRKEAGLGLPLPAGSIAVFEPRGEASLLIGEGAIGDKAVGEEVELRIGPATQVLAKMIETRAGKGWRDETLTVTNANPYPVRIEAEVVRTDDYRLIKPSAAFGRQHGNALWAVEIPANGTATLTYRLKKVRRR